MTARAQLLVNLLAPGGQFLVIVFGRREPFLRAVILRDLDHFLIAEALRHVAHQRHDPAFPGAILVGVERFLDMHRRYPGDDRKCHVAVRVPVGAVTGHALAEHRGRPGSQVGECEQQPDDGQADPVQVCEVFDLHCGLERSMEFLLDIQALPVRINY